jgi:hypothetical protein
MLGAESGPHQAARALGRVVHPLSSFMRHFAPPFASVPSRDKKLRWYAKGFWKKTLEIYLKEIK